MTAHMLRQMGTLKPLREEDPREAILKYAQEAEGMDLVTQVLFALYPSPPFFTKVFIIIYDFCFLFILAQKIPPILEFTKPINPSQYSIWSRRKTRTKRNKLANSNSPVRKFRD
jgi:hypothetical protein